MEQSLQYAFIASRGAPTSVDGWRVQQSDILPLRDGTLRIRFVAGRREDHGICLKPECGSIELADGERVAALNIWRESRLPDTVEYRVHSPSGQVRIWNIYRLKHPDGTVTEDMWTGNAGMVILEAEPGRRRYGCSGGLGEFSPTDLVVDVSWDADD